jgi:hypothetical protein
MCTHEVVKRRYFCHQQLMDCAATTSTVKTVLTAAVAERKAALLQLSVLAAPDVDAVDASTAAAGSIDGDVTVEEESEPVTPGEVLGGVHSWPANACINAQCLLLPTPTRTRGVVTSVTLRFSEDRDTSVVSTFAVVVYRLTDVRGTLRCSQPFRADTTILNDAQTSASLL